MKDEIKEIYLSSLEWTKTRNNMGGVMGNFIFKDKISHEEFNKLFKNKRDYFVLCNKDYITNLQKENKKLKKYYNDYKSRCKKANEYIKLVRYFALEDHVNIISITLLENILQGDKNES